MGREEVKGVHSHPGYFQDGINVCCSPGELFRLHSGGDVGECICATWSEPTGDTAIMLIRWPNGTETMHKPSELQFVHKGIPT
jgi:hypothetical protein